MSSRKSPPWLVHGYLIALCCVLGGILVGTRGKNEREEDASNEGVAKSASLAKRGDAPWQEETN